MTHYWSCNFLSSPMNMLTTRFEAFKEFIFTNPKSGWLWLIVRLYIGQMWLLAGYAKFNNPAWIGESSGAGIAGFVAGALTKTGGAHPDVSSWYAWFLTNCVATAPELWANLITYGEIAVGLGLIFGVCTTFAATGGLLMNFSFLFAGTVSVNPLMILIQLPILLAHRVSGTIGVEKWFRAWWSKRKEAGM